MSSRFKFEFNTDQLRSRAASTAGVSHNDTLYIRYLGGDGVLQGQSTDGESLPRGSFSSSFIVNLDEIPTQSASFNGPTSPSL